jgi:signal transduction histidine kinase
MGNHEIVRALRGTKDSILRDWQTDARNRLWHLESHLTTRKGAVSLCMSATLLSLIELFQESPSPDPEPDLTSDPITSQRSLFAVVEQGSLNWDILPLSWQDIRSLLDIGANQIHQALMDRSISTELIAMVRGALEALAAAIADRRMTHLEQELSKQREESIAIQHLTGRFLANASHELRTPLTAVLGFAELLLEETYGPLTPEQRTAVGHIDNSAQNLLEIVNNLLDLLHIRAGKLKLQYRPVDIAPLLRNLYEILIPLAQRKNVAFSLDLHPTLGVAEVDEGILRHIVYHLLASALRATPKGGIVNLSAHRANAELIILTHDTALHLPPDAIANMMDAFPILENSQARGYEGWEMGLPLVNRYVELHGGKLDLESLQDQGTTFRITLPLGRPTKS